MHSEWRLFYLEVFWGIDISAFVDDTQILND